MKKRNLVKRLSLIGSLVVLSFSLGGCSLLGNFQNDYTNHNARYVKPTRHVAHQSTLIQPISVDFYDTSHPDRMMKDRIYNYLDSIENKSDYTKPQFKTDNVSMDSNHNGNQGETVYVIMHRK